MAHFSVLRRMEILILQIKDVAVQEGVVSVEFPCETKFRVKGFRLELPG